MNHKTSFLAASVCLPFLICSNANAVSLGHGFDLDIELTAVSEYRYMGVSQSQGDPAIQAGATLASPIGLYAGIWASSVDFGDDIDTRREQDYYVGWYIPITDDLSVDVGWLKYEYPKSSELNQSSIYGVIQYKGFELTYQYTDNLNGDQTASYTTVGYTYPINDTTRLNARYGIIDAKDEVFFSASGDSRSRYNEWEISAEKDLWGTTWKASYVDTNLSKTECFNYQGYDDLCSGDVVVSVSKHF
ncbi:TorF family putative porin [Aquipseudomonas campi]